MAFRVIDLNRAGLIINLILLLYMLILCRVNFWGELYLGNMFIKHRDALTSFFRLRLFRLLLSTRTFVAVIYLTRNISKRVSFYVICKYILTFYHCTVNTSVGVLLELIEG